jgi:hypothetical protein
MNAEWACRYRFDKKIGFDDTTQIKGDQWKLIPLFSREADQDRLPR